MSKITLELSIAEMRHLAEISAMALSMLEQAMQASRDREVSAWRKLCISLLERAKSVPSIAKNMELNPDCGYWFFKRSYIDEALFSEVLEEYRDSTFWSELVGRIADQCLMESIGEEAMERLTEEERNAKVSSLEKSLWKEVSTHGINRLLFLMPPHEA